VVICVQMPLFGLISDMAASFVSGRNVRKMRYALNAWPRREFRWPRRFATR